MTSDHLTKALQAVAWEANVSAFLKDTRATKLVHATSLRLAIWAHQLENADVGNPALSFIREMQSAGQSVVALTALALYKPAAGSMRAMFETALYYSYFRTHRDELATLLRDPGFYIQKGDVLDFHRQHTPAFKTFEQKLGLISRLEKWYGNISSIIHGQIPGSWVDHIALADTKPISSTQEKVIASFVEGGEVIHRFFLCTVGQVFWDSFSSTAKKQLIAGLSGDVRAVLKLDSA